MDARTERRYEDYDRLRTERCPSCRAQWHWSEKARAWQATHRGTCRYIPWWRAREREQQKRERQEEHSNPAAVSAA